MDNGKLRIDNIFNGHSFFAIPDYQRSYAWEEKQLRDFFDDYINYNVDDDKAQGYYYGTILLQNTKKGIKEFYDIVDGQQRFTTLIIFMRCLISKLVSMNNPETDFLFKNYIKNGDLYVLKLQDDDNDFFSTVILDGKTNNTTNTPAQKRLLNAKVFFEDRLQQCTDEQIEELLYKVYSTHVLIYLIDNKIESAMIFETTNDRGKSLTNLEKTKSFLMYKASLCLKDPDHMLSKIQKRFSDVYKDFESITAQNIGADENSILQYCYIAYEKWKTDSNAREYTKYMETFKSNVEELARHTNDNHEDHEVLSEYIDTYTYNVHQSFSAYKSMYEGHYPEFMDVIALDRTASFMPLLIKSFRYDETLNKSKFRIICRLCEIFSFRVYVIFDKMANKLQSKWYSLARDFSGDFKSAAEEIIEMINSVENNRAFRRALAAPDFYTKYSSPEKNYFYWKYENYLRTEEQPKSTPLPHEDLRQKSNKKLVMTIEHIVAQANSEEKSRVITDELGIDVGAEEKFDTDYLNSIGNLTLDPLSANASKGKQDVEVKASKYFIKAPYKCQNELEDFLIEGKWTLDSIKNRKKKLLNFAEKTWCDFSFIKELNAKKEKMKY